MNFEEYATQALQVLSTNLRRSDSYLTAAVFGQLLKQANPQKTWKDFGFSSFKGFLEALEQRSLLRLVETDKQALAVKSWSSSETPADVEPNRINRYNPLRKAVWSAFVFSVPEGLRFLHRRRGDIRMGLRHSPTPIDEWVQILPVEESTQKEWGREFAGDDAAAEEALSHPHWHLEFPKALSANHPRKRAEWNRLRSERVSEHVKQWAMHNGISLDILFEEDGATARDKLHVESVETSCRDDQDRAAVLAAINSLPTSDLMRLWMPVGAVLHAVRALPKRQDA